MAHQEPSFGPLQLLVVAFETTENFQGQIARELRDLRGRGLIRVLDARLLSRGRDGELTETDLNQVIGETVATGGRPAAHLFGLNGVGDAGGNGGGSTPETYARTAGFAVDDLRRLTDEIGPGEHAAVVLVEHVWASRLRELVREAGGLLASQGMLTPEVVMIVGAELQAKADAETAIDLADAARGAALLEALTTLGGEELAEEPPPRASAAAAVVRALVDAGFVRDCEAADAIDALAERGIVEKALIEGAAAEAEEFLSRLPDDDTPPPADAVRRDDQPPQAG
jgi:uncharacterized membrane protein